MLILYLGDFDSRIKTLAGGFMPCQDDEEEDGMESRWETFHHIYSTKIEINLRTSNVQLRKYIN